MSVRYDDGAKSIALSVRDLAEAGGPRGHLTLDVVQRLSTRAAQGRAIHTDWQTAQQAVDADYRAEVRLQHQMEIDGWTITLQGRVDGLTDIAGHVVVEEVKSTALSVDRLYDTTLADWPSHVAQLEVYLWMLDAAQHASPIGRLVLVSIADGAHHVLGVQLDAIRVGERINDALGDLVRRRQQRNQWLADRRGREVPIPHGEWRPGQREIAEAVQWGLNAERILLVQAPTGLGKTAAVMAGALRHALEHGKQVFWATARTTQQTPPLDTAQRLIDAGLPLRAVRLRAKEKVCLNHIIACQPEHCPFAEHYHDKVRESHLLEGLVEHGLITDSRLTDAGNTHTVCPFEVALDLSSHVDIVVGDYNYVFDPGAHLRRHFSDDSSGGWIVVVDEAHQLIERARGWLSPRLEASIADAAIDQLMDGGAAYTPFIALARRIGHWVRQMVDRAPLPDGESLARTELDPAPLQQIADDIDAVGLDYALLRADDPLPPEAEDQWRVVARQVLRLSARIAEMDEGSTPIVGTAIDKEFVQVLCLDPSSWLGPRIAKLGGFVGCSATLSPPEFYRDLMGIPQDRLDRIVVPSSFPPERRPVYVLPRVSTLYADRSTHAPRTAALLCACIQEVPGNVAVYFPSFEMLGDLVGRFALYGRRLVVQEPGMSDEARDAMLQTLHPSDDSRPVVLAAVLGGVFAEGIDLPPGALSAVAVVGPALPPIGLERTLLREAFETRYQQGYAYASLVPGMTRVVQASGRLIRRNEDRGIVLLVGRRFRWRDIAGLLPPEWSPTVPEDPLESIRAFFSDPTEP